MHVCNVVTLISSLQYYSCIDIHSDDILDAATSQVMQRHRKRCIDIARDASTSKETHQHRKRRIDIARDASTSQGRKRCHREGYSDIASDTSTKLTVQKTFQWVSQTNWSVIKLVHETGSFFKHLKPNFCNNAKRKGTKTSYREKLWRAVSVWPYRFTCEHKNLYHFTVVSAHLHCLHVQCVTHIYNI